MKIDYQMQIETIVNKIVKPEVIGESELIM